MKGRSPAQAAANQPGDARAGCSSRSFTTPANGPLVHRSLFDEDVTGMPDLEGRNLIDELMPHWERRILRAQPVNAPPERTFAAIRKVDFLRSPVIVAPHRLRVDLDRMIRPRSHDAPPRRREFRFAQLVEEDGGFRLLAEEGGHELVLGFIGRWWERGYGRVAWTADEFSEFARPGYAVGAWGFTVVPTERSRASSSPMFESAAPTTRPGESSTGTGPLSDVSSLPWAGRSSGSFVTRPKPPPVTDRQCSRPSPRVGGRPCWSSTTP
jgi:hypothetical protein